MAALGLERLELDALTAHPAGLVNGQLWHRSDLKHIFARLNGITTQLGKPFDKVIWVDPNNPQSAHATIQAAIDAAANGNVILIAPGFYPEKLVIAKNLTLVSVENHSMMTTGSGPDHVVINPTLLVNEVAVDMLSSSSALVGLHIRPTSGNVAGALTAIRMQVDCGIYQCMVRLQTGVGSTVGPFRAIAFQAATGNSSIVDCSISQDLTPGKALNVAGAGRLDVWGSRFFEMTDGFGDVEVNHASAKAYFHSCLIEGDFTKTAAADCFIDSTSQILGTRTTPGAPSIEGVTPNGTVWYDTATNKTRTREGGVNKDVVAAGAGDKKQLPTLIVPNPTATEDLPVGYTDVAMTISKLVHAVKGTSPSVSWKLFHALTRDAAGTAVITAGTTTTTQSGAVITTFDDATIPANSYFWLETTGKSGTVDFFQLTVIYTED